MTGTAQEQLARFVAQAPVMPEEACNVARVSLVDSLAVAFAGRHEPVHRAINAYVSRALQQPGGATRWLDGAALPPEDAALCNAVAIHALDFDDVTPAWRGHPGTVLWPAILALAAPSCTYAELLDAFVTGVEVGAQIGGGIVNHHYAAGWHATATIGVLAAAAACCRVLRLDNRRTFHALGLAAAQSAGLQRNFGSMAKPLQAGFSVAAAVRAALLASAGAEAGDVLEGPGGFAGLYGGAESLRISLPVRPGELAILRKGIEIKQYANCYAAHRAVDAALAIRNRWAAASAVDCGQIRSIRIQGTKGAHQPLLKRRPTTSDESRFSVEYAVACALLDGKLLLSTFAEDGLRRPTVQALMDVSRVEESDTLGTQRAGRVSVALDDGRMLESTVTSLSTNHGDPAFMQRLRSKVDDCMHSGGVGPWAECLWKTTMEGRSSEPLNLETSLLARTSARPASVGPAA